MFALFTYMSTRGTIRATTRLSIFYSAIFVLCCCVVSRIRKTSFLFVCVIFPIALFDLRNPYFFHLQINIFPI